jgi:SAM-dependent methyltransferase
VTSVLRPGISEALDEWRDRVRANREQAERVREAPERTDFYAPVAAAFKADPRRTGEPALDDLRAMVVPGETWLDIGAGGGRYALPLALCGARVTALDPSAGMLQVLRETMNEFGVEGVSTLEARWPVAEGPHADVAFIAHVGYDIEEIGPFLDAMEEAATRRCVAVLLSSSPATAAASFWPPVHGEPRALLPALPEFLALQLARGRLCEVRLSERPAVTYPSREAMVGFLRQQLFIEAGGEADRRLVATADRLVTEVEPGRFRMPHSALTVGVVSWDPRLSFEASDS